MVDWSDSPIGGWMFEDPELQGLQQAMQKGAQYTQDYRKNAAEARAKGTANRLQAFEPANRVLTKLMGGEDQFDLGALAANNPMTTTPGLFGQGEGAAPSYAPMTPDQLTEETGKVAGQLSAPGGRNDQAKTMSDQQAFYSGLTGPIGPLLGASPAATHNADLDAIYANQQANNAGFFNGQTPPPPWWDEHKYGMWVDPTAPTAQYTQSWYEMTPAEQLQVIREGREKEYQRFDPNNPGQVLMLAPEFKGTLSDEYLNSTLEGEGQQ